MPCQLAQKTWRPPCRMLREQVLLLKGLAAAVAGGHHYHNPAVVGLGLGDVRRCPFGMEGPGDCAAAADFMIRSHERHLALSLEQAADLAVQRLLLGLLPRRRLASITVSKRTAPLSWMPKNGFWVCRASSWISRPSRSSSPKSCHGTARSWFSPVA